ncbi:MAG TPA: carbohydrate ABC transporter permease [Kofleriaceae bacterium]|nr:carbohydrate ABC transporter permease [Kofleriaceae bacterium]
MIRRGDRAVLVTALALLTLPIVASYLWLILASFGRGHDLTWGIFPTAYTTDNWRFLWDAGAVGRDMPSVWLAARNTAVLALSIMLLDVALATNAGYVFSRWTFRGRGPLLAFVMVLHAFPSVTLLVSLFIVLLHMGLLDSLWGIVLVKVALQLPFGIFVMKGFFDSVPWESEMSALMDGCTRLGAYRRVILPQVMPGIAAISIFSFLEGWKEFLFVYAFTFDKSGWTLSLYLQSILSRTGGAQYGLLAAVAVFYMLPVVFFFVFTQKYLTRVQLGGVKG